MAGELPVAIRKELECKSIALDHRYCISISVRFTETRKKLGIVPLYDGRGTVRFGSTGSLVKDKLEEMGVNTEQFIKARPILYTLGYQGKEVACGGLVEPHINDLMRAVVALVPIDVRLTFYASEVLIPKIPLTCNLGIEMHFVKHTGVVVSELEEGCALVKLQQQVPSADGDCTMLCSGSRVTNLNSRRIDTKNPEESFTSVFTKRMLNDPNKASNEYSVTVQIPLFSDPNPPSVALLFDKSLQEAHRALVCMDWNSELHKNGGCMTKAAMDSALQGKAMASYSNARESYLKDPFAVQWCYDLLDDAISKYCMDGSLSRNITINVAEFRERLMTTTAFKEFTPRHPKDKLKQMRTLIKKEIRAVAASLLKRKGTIYIASDNSSEWAHTLWLKCPKCSHPGVHNHIDTHIIFGNVYRVDASRVCPATFFLDKVNWEDWGEVDMVFPSRMQPDRLPYIKGSGMDVRFRAILNQTQYDEFQEKVRALGDSEQRHFKWDTTGECVRQKWSWEAPKRKHNET